MGKNNLMNNFRAIKRSLLQFLKNSCVHSHNGCSRAFTSLGTYFIANKRCKWANRVLYFSGRLISVGICIDKKQINISNKSDSI